MLTKLTKTILEHDQELKKTWESLTPMGRVSSSNPFTHCAIPDVESRWVNLKIWLLVVSFCLFDGSLTFQPFQGAVVFLASDASKFMTGSEIRVDGGYCVI